MPVGVWGILHGLCLKNSCNLPANLGLGVEFPSHGGHALRRNWRTLSWLPFSCRTSISTWIEIISADFFLFV